MKELKVVEMVTGKTEVAKDVEPQGLWNILKTKFLVHVITNIYCTVFVFTKS